MKKIKKFAPAIAGATAILLGGCGAESPSPVVTVTAQPSAPTQTYPQPAQTYTYQDAIADAWDTLTSYEKEQTCSLYNYDKYSAWSAFDEGSKGAIPQSEFFTFFDSVCRGY